MGRQKVWKTQRVHSAWAWTKNGMERTHNRRRLELFMPLFFHRGQHPFSIARFMGLWLVAMVAGCGPQPEKVAWVHQISNVCSQHDETNGTVVVLELVGKSGKVACRFNIWHAGSLGLIQGGVILKEQRPYQHELFPDMPYRDCRYP